MTTKFVNKKSIIFGEDTHDAGLSGDVISELFVNITNPVITTDTCTPTSGNKTVASQNVIITYANNKLYLRAQGRNGTNSLSTINLYRQPDLNTSLASTTVIGGSGWSVQAILINEFVGNQTYVWILTNAGDNCSNQNSSSSALSESNDTHSAILDGDNTQRSTDENILS